ncbi:MAG: hypothetical protein MUD12_16655 [Spirochaetes bacterium]|jgi:hypothetical protein|nr:hypothetical protein [Spirochaetota bacterium]
MIKEKSFKDKINLNELAFDAAILIFSYVLEKTYSPVMESAPLGFPFVLLFILSTIYFLPVLIGSMYNVDFKDSPPFIKRCVSVTLFAVMFFAFFNLLYTIFSGIKFKGPYANFIMAAGVLFLIMGPIAGLMFTRKDAPRIKGASTQVFLFLFTIGMLPFFFVVMLGEEIFGNTGFFAGIFIVFGLLIGDVLFILILYLTYAWCKKFLIRKGVYDACVSILKIMTPFCVSFMLVFFNINGNRLIIGDKGVHDAGSILLVIFLFIVSGILPLRMMMMFTPPVRPLNILIDVIAVAYMVITIVRM